MGSGRSRHRLVSGCALVPVPCGGQPHGEVCPLRTCLPPDTTQDPPLCYSETNTTQLHFTQSFALCPDDRPHCSLCVTEPPCESRCLASPMAQRPPGAECFYDEQCAGNFARCMQRVCRRSLFTHQWCTPSDPNDVCIFGRQTCFRGLCQGLMTGEPCWDQYPEGRDIDCAPGWYCYLAVCAPQLPAGHSCSGQHPHECVRGYRCNLAIPEPVCVRQYTLNLGDKSGDATLCKSNHVDPRQQECAVVPELVWRFGLPVVSGIDCAQDADCPRADESLGRCACKTWWEGGGSPGYCELFVQDSSWPSFKRFWEARVRLCHHDWDDERCAIEADYRGVSLGGELRNLNTELRLSTADPTAVKACGATLLASEFVELGRAARRLWAGWWLPLVTVFSLVW